jgi:hypothetical protein
MAQRWTCTACAYSAVYRTGELAEALFPKHACKPTPPKFRTFPAVAAAAARAFRWPTMTGRCVSDATRRWGTC